MRPRRPAPSTPGTVPPELLVGPCAEVWALDGSDLLDARSRYGVARRSWEAETGLDRRTSYALLPASGPWRASDPAGPAHLARYGMTPARLPELRAAALARVAALPAHHRRTT